MTWFCNPFKVIKLYFHKVIFTSLKSPFHVAYRYINFCYHLHKWGAMSNFENKKASFLRILSNNNFERSELAQYTRWVAKIYMMEKYMNSGFQWYILHLYSTVGMTNFDMFKMRIPDENWFKKLYTFPFVQLRVLFTSFSRSWFFSFHCKKYVLDFSLV